MRYIYMIQFPNRTRIGLVCNKKAKTTNNYYWEFSNTSEK